MSSQSVAERSSVQHAWGLAGRHAQHNICQFEFFGALFIWCAQKAVSSRATLQPFACGRGWKCRCDHYRFAFWCISLVRCIVAIGWALAYAFGILHRGPIMLCQQCLSRCVWWFTSQQLAHHGMIFCLFQSIWARARPRMLYSCKEV